MIADIIISALSILGILAIGWYLLIRHQTKNFNKYLKINDPVSFFENDYRDTGGVTKITEMYIHIQTISGVKKVLKSNVHPIPGYKYKE